MRAHYYFSLKTQDIDVLGERLSICDEKKVVRSVSHGRFDYATCFCMLGDSFVSSSCSGSGWAYKNSGEMDGIMIMMPEVGAISWKNLGGSQLVKSGQVALTDYRSSDSVNYEPGVKYRTAYIADVDLFRGLTMLLGQPPKARVYFSGVRGGGAQRDFIANIVDNVISYASSASLPIGGVTRGLKESLVAFVLYNFENNYSRILNDPHSIFIPAPYIIKKAELFMVENLSRDITVSEIALQAGISIRSLQMGFKKFKNTTPMRFLRGIRLQRSREMLASAECKQTPIEIAMACGFTNYQLYQKYYFSLYGERPIDFLVCQGKSSR
ncbi:AraC family transcriptional regulator [Pseudomonas syringae]|nr:AraC family transcriptional regulator [Pseudomonas syringae]